MLSKNKVKIVFLDVDGVMTNGSKVYDVYGEVMAKSFCDQDFTAIKMFEALGIPVYLISGDDRVNKAMASRRNLRFIHTMKKATEMIKVCHQHKCELQDAVYVGDDVYDIPALMAVGYPYIVADGFPTMHYGRYKEYQGDVRYLDVKGGEKAVADLYYELVRRGAISDEAVHIWQHS